MNGGTLSEFSLWRCRLQRMSDAKIFSGWVEETSNGGIVVDLGEAHGFSVGIQFHVELSGRRRTAMGCASIERVDGHRIALVFGEAPMIVATTTAARRRASGLTGMLEVRSDDIVETIDIVDIGEHGIGVHVPVELPARTIVDIRLQSNGGLILAGGQVRYCRPHPKIKDMFRMGIEFLDGRHPNIEIWNRLLDGHRSDSAAA